MPRIENHNSNNFREVVAHVDRCIDQRCSGYLVDSISGKYWVKCLDPRHNVEKEQPRQTRFAARYPLNQFAEIVSNTKALKECEQSLS